MNRRVLDRALIERVSSAIGPHVAADVDRGDHLELTLRLIARDPGLRVDRPGLYEALAARARKAGVA